MQNDKETVTRHYVVDYLSIANRDIFVTEDGSYTTRYVYDASGKRISAEFDYAEGTQRGEAGENLQSDIAAEIGKVFYRTSILGSTLFAVDKNGEVIAHAIYDPWGKPITETYTDSNYSGLENLNNYTGYTYDLTLALYFAQNRFYDAETHRFTQEDTAKDGMNWYVYCGNGPTLRVDVFGLMPRADLNGISWLFCHSLIDKKQMALIVLMLNISNLYVGFHEIAQLCLARYLYLNGQISFLEYPIDQKSENDSSARKRTLEADITDGKHIWEVKPKSRWGSYLPDRQLSKYLIATGQSAGYPIDLDGINFYNDCYMGIMSSSLHPGIEYNYFYRLNCSHEQVPVSSVTIFEEIKSNITWATIIAVAIIVATVVEDIATSGIGVADDIASLLGALAAAGATLNG